MRLTAVAMAAMALLAACAAPAKIAGDLPRAYPDGERVFHGDPRWLGGDAAISVPLGRDRTLWLFGDSFIGTEAHPARRTAAFIHNSVSVESGLDPRRATMRFAWRRNPAGGPAAMFTDDHGAWFWPASGMRLPNGTLALFLTRIAATPGKSAPLGFAVQGYVLVLVDNPDAPPEDWHQRRIAGPALPFDALPGAAAIMDGDDVVVLATRQGVRRSGMLVRYAMADLLRGDLSRGRWWAGIAQGWVLADALPPAGPAIVMDEVPVEMSLDQDTCGAYRLVSSQGFGATTVVMRTAPALTGPWGAASVVYRPPESAAPGAFVYAGKAHAELEPDRPDALVVTYIASSFRPDDLVAPPGDRALYWPRMALVAAPACAVR